MPSPRAEQDLLADRLLAAIASLRRVSRRSARRPTELFSLTGSQLELVRLVRRKPDVSVAEAASELRLAPNTVSTLVRQLADVGILSRLRGRLGQARRTPRPLTRHPSQGRCVA